MYKLDKNTSHKLYYKANNLVGSQNVKFTVFDYSGRYYAIDTPATGEIVNPDNNQSHGLYYYDFKTPNEDIYLFCLASLVNGSNKEATLISCGVPATQMVFYLDSNYRVGLSLEYQIYDLTGTVLKSGILDEICYGYYGIGIDGLYVPGTFFFKCGTQTEKFLLPLQYVNANVILNGGGGASKTPYNSYNYTSDLVNRRINARLVEDGYENSPKGIIFNSIKEKDDEKAKFIAILNKTIDEFDKSEEVFEKMTKKRPEVSVKLINTGIDEPFEIHSKGINPDLNKKDYRDRTNVVDV